MEEPAPRMFWPQQVWARYAGELADFKEPSNRTAAVQCLNHLVTDALRHLPHCLSYMAAVQHPMNFRFCAIPQIMAMGTLALCYNNGKLFEGEGPLGSTGAACWCHLPVR
jgi:farnesyl-diphosphate farnesyltransferase